MSVKTEAELRHLRAIGRIVRLTLEEMAAAVRPGATTAEIDAIGAASLARHGAESSPPKVYGFPGTACISVNEEANHGIPGPRRLQEGDLVKLDLTAEKDGFVADAAITVRVGQVSPVADSLAKCAERAFREALKAAVAGNRVCDIGRAVEREVRRSGFHVVASLFGHGVGRTIHEEPTVPNYYDPRFRTRLAPGMVITIEPIISVSADDVRQLDDGWTLATIDGSLAAHHEHSLVVTRGRPIVLTAA